MIRVGHVMSYNTRKKAEKKSLKLAKEIYKEFKL
jgi:hypothetical protein